MTASLNNNETFEMQVLILSAFVIAMCLVGFIIYFVFLYQKKQIQNKAGQETLRLTFKQELLKTQIEVQDQTFNYISQEIHDNITQVLSFVKLNLALKGNLTETEKQKKITESRDLVAQAITDLRQLSKSMSLDYIEQMGLVKFLGSEADRINKSGLLLASINVNGKARSLGTQRELVLFRIFQEALNNTLKHANAKQLNIGLDYGNEIFNLTLDDDGEGFLIHALPDKAGSGLKNIQNRAKLIGAAANITSEPGKGCSIKLSLNLLDKHYIDGYHPDSFG